MPRPTLPPDLALDVLLSARCTAHQYDTDPTVLLEELREIAGRRVDILARVAGEWAWAYRSKYTASVARALLTIAGASEHYSSSQGR